MDPVVPLPAIADAPELQRKRLHKALAVYVMEVAAGRRRASALLGRELLDGIAELLLRTAIREGHLRLPGGWGTLSIAHHKPRVPTRRLPDGRRIPVPLTYVRLRYVEGSQVHLLLGRPSRAGHDRRYKALTRLTPKALKAAGFTR